MYVCMYWWWIIIIVFDFYQNIFCALFEFKFEYVWNIHNQLCKSEVLAKWNILKYDLSYFGHTKQSIILLRSYFKKEENIFGNRNHVNMLHHVVCVVLLLQQLRKKQFLLKILIDIKRHTKFEEFFLLMLRLVFIQCDKQWLIIQRIPYILADKLWPKISFENTCLPSITLLFFKYEILSNTCF